MNKSDYQTMIENNREELYTVDIGHTMCVCNKYGWCVAHGSKSYCEGFIKKCELQPELFD